MAQMDRGAVTVTMSIVGATLLLGVVVLAAGSLQATVLASHRLFSPTTASASTLSTRLTASPPVAPGSWAASSSLADSSSSRGFPSEFLPVQRLLLKQESALPRLSLISMVATAAACAAAAAAVHLWRRASRRVPLLQPAFMECGTQPKVAMMYSAGRRSTGRRNMEVYNLFDRVSRLVRSNVTSLVQSLEDPEKIIEQAVKDMQADLIKVRQSYAEVLATYKRTEVKQRQVLETVAQWQRRAELALTAGDEELAREALRRKNAEQKALDGLNTQLAQSEPVLQNLLNSMKLLEDKLDEAKANKAQLIARAKSAQTVKQVNDMLSGMDTGNAMAAFERMEEKVGALEASAEVAGLLAEGSTMDKRFKALEGSSAVEDELAAMKRQLTGETRKPTAYLPPATDEDEELERIRQQLQAR
eukprot:EG_transcript_10556